MHALRLVAALYVLLSGTAHAQWNLPSERGGVGSSCTLTDGRRGICKKIEECQQVIDELQKGIQPTTCFLDRFVAVPCCPVKEQSMASTPQTPPKVTTTFRPKPTPTQKSRPEQPLVYHDPIEDSTPRPAEDHSLLQIAQKRSSCTLTDGRKGICKKIEQCQQVIEELQKGIQPTTCFLDHFVAVPCCPVKEQSMPSTPQTPLRPKTTPTQKSRPEEPLVYHYPIEDSTPRPAENDSLLELSQKSNYLFGSYCTLADGRKGICKKIEQCQQVIDELQNGIQPTTCFLDHFVAVPCCPVKEQSTFSTPRTPPKVTTQMSQPGQPLVCHDPIEDWTPSPAEERSLLQLAQKKCVEYRQYVYQLILSPILIGGEQEFINISTCTMDKRQLLAGVPASAREFPHMAVIGYGDGKTSWQCGGSLISSRHILTAAHCVTSPSEGCAQRVLLGALLLNETNRKTEPQEFNIVRRIRHPRYNPPKRYNDIAIFELDHDVSFTGYVRPACLYDTFAPPVSDKGIAVGFGRQHWRDGGGSNILLKSTLPFQPFNLCNKIYRTSFSLPNGIDDNAMLCAGDMRGNKDTCEGDSGGPLQVRDIEHCMYKIIGVTSFGSSVCGAENTPTIYTRVSNYIPWIAKIIWT